MKRQLSLVILVALAICTQLNLSSCKKSDRLNLDDQEALLMDSTYFFSLAYSLWNTSLPQPQVVSDNTLDLRRFTRNYSDAEGVLDALIKFMPLDRFSFIDRDRQVDEEIGQGLRRDLGISPQFMRLNQSSNDVGLFIRLTQRESPATHVALKRGDRITGVDGRRISFTVNSNGQVQGDIAAFNKMMRGDVHSLMIYDRVLEQEFTREIPWTGPYNVSPFVKLSGIRLDNGKIVRYVAYDSFVSVRDSKTLEPNKYHDEMFHVFNGLSTDIDELVVDLRYNGGGAGDAAELMVNLIAPSSANGQLMYDYAVNDILRSIPNNPFVPKHIDKTGLPDLNLTKVYFLVTDRSASASEMVINCLKPYMDVQVISSSEGTYGKPVGSFRTRVLNGYADLYITSFKTINAHGYGDYFKGIAANKKNVPDNLAFQLGDPQEDLFAEAMFHIKNNRYRTPSEAAVRASTRAAGKGRGESFEALNVPDLERSIEGLFIFDKVNLN